MDMFHVPDSSLILLKTHVQGLFMHCFKLTVVQ